MPIRPANFPVAELAGTSLSRASGVAGAASSLSAQGAAPSSVARGAATGATGATIPISGDQTGADFTAKLREALNDVNAEQVRAETASQDYANGKQNDLHGTMITMAEADVSLRLTANVRNRVIEAYREVMRMGS